MGKFILKEIEEGFEFSNPPGMHLCNYKIKGSCSGHYVIEKQYGGGETKLMEILSGTKEEADIRAYDLAIEDITKVLGNLDNFEDKTEFARILEQTTKAEQDRIQKCKDKMNSAFMNARVCSEE